MVDLLDHGGNGDRKMVFSGGGSGIPLLYNVLFLKFQTVDSKVHSNVVHHPFNSKKCLRGTKPTIGPGRSGVGF